MMKMMKFLEKNSNASLNPRRFGPSISMASVYSSQTQPRSSDTLYHRLQRCNERRVSLIPALDEWAAEGRELHHHQLKSIIIDFRRSHRFRPALEIAEWMSLSMKHFAITSGHVAVQLDLISKVHGLEQAESYFNSLDDSLIGLPVYAALLNCYASAKSLEKAEATMEEIRKLNSCSTLVYNTMLSLYSKLGMHKKLNSLMGEMEEKGIEFNNVTYNIRLNAYADSDLERMEKLLMKMEVDPSVTVDFYSYTTAAKGYLRAGDMEKTSEVLKKAEHLIKGLKRKFAFGTLITYYAAMQKKEDVYRLLDKLRNCGKLHYGSLLHIFTSLEKLGDLEGARKILEEWEENNSYFDIRIPNLVLSAYCKKGRIGEAETILNRLIETGVEPSAKSWSYMALGYYKDGRMEKAVEMTKKAFVAAFPGWKPDVTTVAACLEYLKKKRDADEIYEMLMLLDKYGSFSVDFKERIRRYLAMESQST